MQTLDTSPSVQKPTFEQKIDLLQKKFLKLSAPEDKYHLLMDMGKSMPQFDPQFKTDEFLVRGCQSQLFLHACKNDEKIFFTATSDSLISAGLAALLIEIYNGETLETILANPPQFLQTLGIYASLSPNRAHGVIHIYLKMKMLSIMLQK